jgi:hypothetical protein
MIHDLAGRLYRRLTPVLPGCYPVPTAIRPTPVTLVRGRTAHRRMEDNKMNSRITIDSMDRLEGGGSPEEKAILARFLRRASRGAHRAVDALNQGSFLVL